MPRTVPDYFENLIDAHQEVLCGLLTRPGLWSETMATRTLRRMGGQAHNIEDVQNVIKDYLVVLSDAIRRGERFET